MRWALRTYKEGQKRREMVLCAPIIWLKKMWSVMSSRSGKRIKTMGTKRMQMTRQSAYRRKKQCLIIIWSASSKKRI